MKRWLVSCLHPLFLLPTGKSKKAVMEQLTSIANWSKYTATTYAPKDKVEIAKRTSKHGVSATGSHWSNEETMLDYLKDVLFPAMRTSALN